MHRRGILLVLIAGLLGSLAAMAFAQGYLGEPRAQYRVFVIGDILGGGLWAGMTRMNDSNGRISVNGRYKEESGLARPEIYDWAGALPGIMENNPSDILVIMIGTNDRQDIRAGDKTLTFGSPEWQTIYRANVDALLTAARDLNLKVYWVELPPLPDPAADEQIKLIDKLQREQTETAGSRFLDFRKRFATEDDKYTTDGVDADGQFRRLRSTSTIKFLKVGNNRLAKDVFEVIQTDIDIADGKASPEEAPAPVADETVIEPSPAGPVANIPLIGQAAANGDPLIVSQDDLPSGSSSAVARLPVGLALPQGSLTPEIVMQSLRLTAPPGSQAEELFTTGNWPAAPTGRIDNYQLSTKDDPAPAPAQ